VAQDNGLIIKDVNEFSSTSDEAMLARHEFFAGGMRVNRVLRD